MPNVQTKPSKQRSTLRLSVQRLSAKRLSMQRRAATAIAVCVVGSAAQGLANNADIVPVLVRTTNPVRISDPPSQSADSIPFSMPRDPVSSASLEVESSTEGTAPSTESTALGYNQATEAIRNLGRGKTRINRFVGFRTGTSTSDRKPNSASPETTSLTSWTSGEIQSNPLVVDSPPKLRRFSPSEPARQSVAVSSQTLETIESETGLRIAREVPVDRRDPADLDNVFDALSLDSIEPSNELLSDTARDSGFGLLAIDQIGRHLPNPIDSRQQASAAIAQRFPNDAIAGRTNLSNDAESFRERLGYLDTNEFAAEGSNMEQLPTLPPPSDSEIATLAEETSSPETNLDNEQDEVAFDPLPSPYRPSADGPVPLELEDLVNSARKLTTLPNLAEEPLPPKPSIADRLTSWANRIKGGAKKNPPNETSAPSRSSSSGSRKTLTKPARPTGLFNRLFKK